SSPAIAGSRATTAGFLRLSRCPDCPWARPREEERGGLPGLAPAPPAAAPRRKVHWGDGCAVFPDAPAPALHAPAPRARGVPPPPGATAARHFRPASFAEAG